MTRPGALRRPHPTGPAPAPAPAPDSPPALLLPSLVGTALAVLAVTVLATGGPPRTSLPGLPDAGALTAWGLPAATLLFHLAAVATVGSLLVGAALLPADDQGALHGSGLRAVRAATRSAFAWAVLAALTALLTVSDVAGLGVPDVLLGRAGGWNDALSLPGVRGLVITAVAAASLASYASTVRTTVGGWVLLGGSLLALTPVLFAGHSAESSGHVLATTSLVVHVLAATLWVGGLLGLVLHLRTDGEALTRAVPAFSVLAAGCLALVGATGLAAAWNQLGSSPSTWVSAYGAVVLAKVLALVALGALGWLHRARMLPRLAAGAAGGFRRLAAGELLVMAAAFALGVALARTPTPVRAAAESAAPAHGAGHDTLPSTVQPFSLDELLTGWEPDAVALSLVAVAAVGYLRGVLLLRRRGGHWPLTRTAAYTAGLVLTALVTSGGTAVYAPALVSVHLGRFLVLALVVPLLVVLGRPLLLADQLRPVRSGGLRPALRSGPVGRALADPVVAAVLWGVVAAGLYLTPLLELTLRSVQAYLLAGLVEVGVGLVLVAALLPPAAATTRARRTVGVLGVAGVLGVLALQLATRSDLLAADWFGTLRFSWADPVADQRRAAGLALVALQVLTPLLLVTVWSREAQPGQPTGSTGRSAGPAGQPDGPARQPARPARQPARRR